MADAAPFSATWRATASPRVDWVDTAKGICIILIVMTHSTLGLGLAVGKEGWLHHAVAFGKPFRMPDFFMVAGLFLSRIIDRDWRTYADRRIVNFVYFYVLWTLIQFAFKGWGLSGGNPAELGRQLALTLVEPFGTLWFIYVLVVFATATKLARRLPLLLLVGFAAALEIAPLDTGWTAIDESAARYVYFVVGYVFAPKLFAFAARAARRQGLALAGLALWGTVNGTLALTPTGLAAFPTLASLPLVSLALGLAGACAIITAAALLNRAGLAGPLTYCGHNAFAIYLAFFLPMAAMRELMLGLGLVGDVDAAALAVTFVAVVVPLLAARLVRGSWAECLFVRPLAFRLGARHRPLAPAQ